ncbi:MAG: electron transfer flavoprotein subunit alpha [Firmicutes bacterium]|nr:electron transfer flavoprotein subunit alpha [Bacillota bacterium]
MAEVRNVVQINRSMCIGDAACIDTCPQAALDLEEGIAKLIEPDRCDACGLCLDVCPTGAITLPLGRVVKQEASPAPESNPSSGSQAKPEVASAAPRPTETLDPRIAGYAGVWVYLEHDGPQIVRPSLELLSIARTLADTLHVPLSAILVTDDVAEMPATAAAYGADQIYVASDPRLAFYRTEAYARVVIDAIQAYKPEIVLVPATPDGRDLASAIATDLQTALTADCTELAVDLTKRQLLATRPAFGGNMMATIVAPHHRPQLATVRPGTFPLPEKTTDCPATILPLPVMLRPEDERQEILAIEPIEHGPSLQDAEIIVAGGRGMGSKEGFTLIEQLARLLGGMPAASRPCVEACWVPYTYQVGQTGQTVRPKVYIALGISGAVQHVVGMKNAECIIAINNDPRAPIFQVAHYGIVADAFELLPRWIKRLEAKSLVGEER